MTSVGQIAKRIEECLIATVRIKAETQVTDTDEIFKILNSTLPSPMYNVVYRTRFPREVSDDLICKHLESYRQQRISFRWHVFDHNLPQDLGDKLARLSPSAIIKSKGLYIDVDTITPNPLKNLTVEEVDKNNLEEYITTKIEGWGSKDEEARRVRQEAIMNFENGNLTHKAFLARYKGEAASTGLVRVINGTGYLLGGNTKPHLRGKGIYKALVSHRLQVLKNQNIKLAVVLAMEKTSAPICEKIGFKVACETKCYEFNFVGR